ncbi:MAG TPA: ATP-binding cassette domain-containing protein [Chloroflexota bacterium]|nr:ATP-binding cassette domain-containing protein [Chloroflexota bacterium]
MIVEAPAPDTNAESRRREPAIQARNLVKVYKGSVRALDNLSFEVEAGIVFGLLGPNGAGKSSTVKILTTLSRPDSGQALVDGVDVLRRPNEVRRRIGCIGQKSGVDREATGRENLTLQGQLFGLRGRRLKSRVSELLERFNLAEAADRVVRNYSGGMSRRLDIAIGLVHKPRVLFMDEPTTGLDPEVRVDMWDEIARLAREENITVLLTTHYLEEADRLAQRLVIVDQGRIVAEGSPEDLKSELGGDVVQIAIRHGSSTATAASVLQGLVEVSEVAVDGSILRARAADGAAAVPVVLSRLEAEGIGVSSVTVSRPSLDDVYLRYAGRSFEKADREGAGA